ncbi:ABC transporter, transmembrane domain, type 1 [Beauveria brongniartii RCEF 3172]|uniref:ABC transporter, transmembrane domain, type 1 n=1 Tax=Beauveria brongniartii RCEF 3172 TaxID=1081107 RepID=A0A166YA94_9HYPO|nr:ABC transporter, transmembrane domain, type 1 [Beauveria brongniartii RCEF 3172]
MIPSREDRRQFMETITPVSGQGPVSALPGAPTDKRAVKLHNVSVRPASTADLVLKNISTVWKRGDLVVISVSVGAGKTSLAKALLGELSQDSGLIQTAYKTVAYCAQVAWLVNGTAKEVICGPGHGRRTFDAAWDKRVVHACDLEEDFARMPDGDQTVIGSRSITLSGGQKQRIALARAIFAGQDLIILDDTLSALDASTQRHITNNLFGPNGLFKELGTTVLRAIDLEARALVDSSFLETLGGVATIRAFGWPQAFSRDNAQKLDLSLRPDYMLTCVQRWLDLVLDLIVPGLAICIIGLGVVLKGTTTGGQIGLALNVVLQANRYILRLVSAWTRLETSLGAISRVREFEQSVLPEEEPGQYSQPPTGWPAHGAVDFANVSASYNDSMLVLDGVSLTIAPGTKVGVVGRTGSGKSSLLLTLLRLVELQGPGKVYVDGLDICDLSRNAMRARFITVPQDPMLVKIDTVRQNLDIAATDLSEEEMVRALQRVGLWQVLLTRRDRETCSESSSVMLDDGTRKQSPLAHSVEADGVEQLPCNESVSVPAAAILGFTMDSVPLSQGQEQLFSLARALLMRRTRGRVVLLDEATSSVDAETDGLLQRILREEFGEYTVITVAHRLDTIMDSDVVLAMHGGKLVEAGPPSELVEKEGGILKALLSGKKLKM